MRRGAPRARLGQVEWMRASTSATRESSSVDAICSQCLPEIGVAVSGRNVVVLSAVKPRDAHRNGTDKQIKQKHSNVFRSSGGLRVSVCLARRCTRANDAAWFCCAHRTDLYKYCT